MHLTVPTSVALLRMGRWMITAIECVVTKPGGFSKEVRAGVWCTGRPLTKRDYRGIRPSSVSESGQAHIVISTCDAQQID